MDTKNGNNEGTSSVSSDAKSQQLNSSTSQPAGNDDAMPNSKRVYVAGTLHPDLRVPFREISLSPTKAMGTPGGSPVLEVNEPVRVYDTSGPWGDPSVDVNVTRGLSPLRRDWITARGDVEQIEGRKVQPIDDGYLSEKHAEAGRKRPTPNVQRPTSKSEGGNGTSGDANGSKKDELRIKKLAANRRPLRAKSGAVTQLAYARRGIITPEMEFIALRENGKQSRSAKCETLNEEAIRNPQSAFRNGVSSSSIKNQESRIARNDLSFAHAGESFGANIP